MKKRFGLIVAIFIASLFSIEANGQGIVADSIATTSKSVQPKPAVDKPAAPLYTNPDRVNKPTQEREMQQQNGKKERLAPAGVPTFQTIPTDKTPKNNGCSMIKGKPMMTDCAIESALC